ncbi:SNF2 family N-terminal domain-containing protein [Pilobolus umbonatus]|nr:SNF2 family N-terminal domain-containing protein [Pilobolus umbonatus]
MSSTTNHQTICEKCQNGVTDMIRLSVRPEVGMCDRRLFHFHSDEDLETILKRLCQDFPSDWRVETTYYFYLDLGGVYHPVEHESWLRDKDSIVVTQASDVSEFPKLNLSAVHAALRPNVVLRPHQEEGVQRMTSMEIKYRGGILADDMGLGKTIQMLTLILRQQPKIIAHACTLVLTPSRSVADQWAEEIRTKTTYGSLPYFIYNEEAASLLEQPCFRVVITTYDRLRADYKRKMSGNYNGVTLFDIQWYRVVLDESHKVRTMKTILTESVLDLQTRFKWCLSGTPFQNELSELHPVFTFMEVPLDSKKKFEQDYLRKLLHIHMIRRTKRSLNVELTILPPHISRIELNFSPSEKALYEYLETLLYKKLNEWKLHDYKRNNITATSLLYLRLKQVCNHHQIVLEKFPDLIPLVTSNNDEEIMTAIGHEDIPSENTNWDERTGELQEASALISSYHDQFEDETNKVDLDQLQRLKYKQHSAKIEWLIAFLQQTLASNDSDKIVIVTQFVDFIHKIVDVLNKSKLSHEVYHGSMSHHARRKALSNFNLKTNKRIIVISLKAGGVGLNLQRANHMIILDRWWNPATMDQAVARIHRMTQHKQTYVYIVIIKNTIEEGLMDNILKKKNLLFDNVIDLEYDDLENEDNQDFDDDDIDDDAIIEDEVIVDNDDILDEGLVDDDAAEDDNVLYNGLANDDSSDEEVTDNGLMIDIDYSEETDPSTSIETTDMEEEIESPIPTRRSKRKKPVGLDSYAAELEEITSIVNKEYPKLISMNRKHKRHVI